MSDRVRNYAAITAQGSFVLLLGNILALSINAIGAILIALMLSPSDYGLYTITFTLPGFFILFASVGVDSALVRFLAKERLQKTSFDYKKYVTVTYKFKLILSLVLTILLFISSDILSSSLLGRPEISKYVRWASFYILSLSIHNTSIAILSGLERMDYRAFLVVLQSIIKGVLSPLLVYYGFGVFGPIFGYVSSLIVVAIIGFFLVTSLTSNNAETISEKTQVHYLKELLAFGFPLFIGTFITGIAIQFRGFLLSWFVSAEIIGNFGVALWFITFVGALLTSLRLNFFPAFSKFNISNEYDSLKEIYLGSIRYSTIFLVPIIIFIISVSDNLVLTLFGVKYPQASFFLSMLMVPSLYVGIGSLSNNILLNSQGETRISMIINLIGSISFILLSYTFINIWSINGLLLSLIISDLLRNTVANYIIYKKYNFNPLFTHTLKTYFCSIFSFLLVYSYTQLTPIKIPIINLIISAFIFMIGFLSAAPIIQVIESKDIENINLLFKDQNRLYPVIQKMLLFWEIILQKTNKKRKRDE